MISNSKIYLSGFTFVKHALSLGFPIVESINSVAPLCEEFIINVGFSDPSLKKDDGTYQFLRDQFSSPKFKFMKSFWDPKKIKGGLILSEQTNLALQKCQGKFCHYIQADEAISEVDYENILQEIKAIEPHRDIHGLAFNYYHFYGHPQVIKHTRNTYRREVRIIRNHQNIISFQDAQGFRYSNQQKILSAKSKAWIYHYGWARNPKVMAKKVKVMDKLYQDNKAKQKEVGDEFSYDHIWGLRKFQGTHPKIMQPWINEHSHGLENPMNKPKKWEWKNIRLAISDGIEHLTGIRAGEFKNFKEAKLPKP